MSLIYRRRKRLGERSWLNLSRFGASVSTKPHDRVTVNSRGTISIRLLPGLSWKGRLW